MVKNKLFKAVVCAAMLCCALCAAACNPQKTYTPQDFKDAYALYAGRVINGTYSSDLTVNMDFGSKVITESSGQYGMDSLIDTALTFLKESPDYSGVFESFPQLETLKVKNVIEEHEYVLRTGAYYYGRSWFFNGLGKETIQQGGLNYTVDVDKSREQSVYTGGATSELSDKEFDDALFKEVPFVSYSYYDSASITTDSKGNGVMEFTEAAAVDFITALTDTGSFLALLPDYGDYLKSPVLSFTINKECRLIGISFSFKSDFTEFIKANIASIPDVPLTLALLISMAKEDAFYLTVSGNSVVGYGNNLVIKPISITTHNREGSAAK